MKRFVTWAAFALLIAAGLRADGPRKQDVPRYIQQLQKSPSAQVRAGAAEALGHRGAIKKSDVKEAVEPLLSALQNDRDYRVRCAAARALGEIAPDNKAAVKPLAEALQDKSMQVRIAAARALGALGPDAAEAADALREIKRQADRMRRDRKPTKGTKKPSKKQLEADRLQRELGQAAGMALRYISGGG